MLHLRELQADLAVLNTASNAAADGAQSTGQFAEPAVYLSVLTPDTALLQTRANHVILLEPSLDPAIQQQAVARVHRITQRREVTVHRLLVKDTVEVGIAEVPCLSWHAKSQLMSQIPRPTLRQVLSNLRRGFYPSKTRPS